MPRKLPAAGQWPRMVLVCIDAAYMVWAAHAERPNEEALLVGNICRVGQKWAYETTAEGRGKELAPNERAAAEALMQYLTTGNREGKAA